MVAEGHHHTDEAKQRISESKRHEKNRAPLQPQLCACGCGEYAAIDERRNRTAKYVAGHNSRVNHPMGGKHHTDQARAKLASYSGEHASGHRHGWTRTPTYNSWLSMVSRCRDASNASYRYYGARGITVCERWHDFLLFLEDMGARPGINYNIDRIDPDGNYERSNCRWITAIENQARKRSGWPTRRANQQR